MPSFLSKVFGRKKSDDSPSSSSTPKPIPSRSSPSLLDGKYEAVSPTVSPSAARFQLPRSQQQRAPHLSLHFPARTGNDTDATKLDAVFEDAGVPGDVMLGDEVLGRTRLGIKELLPLVKACAQAITERGLETLGLMHPHWYSASPVLQRKLISVYLLGGPLVPSAPQTPSGSATGHNATSDLKPGISDAFTFHLSSASPHDAASVLRWACRHFSNTPSFNSSANSESYAWYQSFATAEQNHNYATDSYPTLVPNHLSPDHLELLATILDLTSRLAAHAEASGVSGSKFAKLVGPWLLAQDRIGSSASSVPISDFNGFYGEWDTAGRIFEHLFLARLRSTSGQLPKRLATLVNGYPWGAPVTQGKLKLLTKPVASTRTHEAFLITIDSILPNTAGGKPANLPKRHPLLIVHDALHALPTSSDSEGAEEQKEAAQAWEAAKSSSKEAGDVDALAKRVFAEETLNLLSLVPLTSGSGATTGNNAGLTSSLGVLALSPDRSTSTGGNSHRRSTSASASTSAGPSSLSAVSSAPALSTSTSQTTAPGSSTSAKPSSPVDLLMAAPRSRASAAPAWTFTDWSEFQALGFTGPPESSSAAGKSPEAARSEEALNLAATLRETDPYVEVTRPASPTKGGFGGLSRRGSQKRPGSPPILGGSKKGTPRLSLDIPASPSQAATTTGKEDGEEGEKAKEVRTTSVKLVKMDEAFVDAWADALTDPAVTRAWPLFVVAQLRNPVSLPSANQEVEGGKEAAKEGRKIGWVVLERTFTRPAPVPRVQVQPPVTTTAPTTTAVAASQSTVTLTSEGGKDSSKGKEKKSSKGSTPSASPRPSIGAERMSSTLSATKRRLGGFGGLFNRTISSGGNGEGANLERDGSKSKKAKKEKRKSGAVVGEMGEILKEEDEPVVDAAQVPLPPDTEEPVKTPQTKPAALTVPNAEEQEDDKGRFIERFTPGYTPRPSDLTPKDHQEHQVPAQEVEPAASEEVKDTNGNDEKKSEGLGSTVVAAAAGVAAVAAGAAAAVLPSALGGEKAEEKEDAKDPEVHEEIPQPTEDSKAAEPNEEPKEVVEQPEALAAAPTVEEPTASAIEDHIPAAPTPPPETAPVVEELAEALDVPISSEDVPAAEAAEPEVAPEPEAASVEELAVVVEQEATPSHEEKPEEPAKIEEKPYTLAMGPTPEELISDSEPAPEAPTSPPPTEAQAGADEPPREDNKSPQVTAVFSSHLSPQQAVREVPDTEDLRPDSQLSLRSPPPFVPFAAPASPAAQDKQPAQQAQQDVEVEEITLQTPVAEKLRADYLLDRPAAVVAPITPAVERPREEVEVPQQNEAEPELPALQVPEPVDVETTVTPEVVEGLEKAAAEEVENLQGGPVAGGDVVKDEPVVEAGPTKVQAADITEPAAEEAPGEEAVAAEPIVEEEPVAEAASAPENVEDTLAVEQPLKDTTSAAVEEPAPEAPIEPSIVTEEPAHTTEPEVEAAPVLDATPAEPIHDQQYQKPELAAPQEDHHEAAERVVEEDVASVEPSVDASQLSEEPPVQDDSAVVEPENAEESIAAEATPQIAQELASVEEPVAVGDAAEPIVAPVIGEPTPVDEPVVPAVIQADQEEPAVISEEKDETEHNTVAEPVEADAGEIAPVVDELPAFEVPAPTEVAPAVEAAELKYLDTQEPPVVSDAEGSVPIADEEPTLQEPPVEPPALGDESTPVAVEKATPNTDAPADAAIAQEPVVPAEPDVPVSEEQSVTDVEDVKEEPSAPNVVEQEPFVEESSTPLGSSEPSAALEETTSAASQEDAPSSATAAEEESGPDGPPAEPEGHSAPTDTLVITPSFVADDAKSEIHMPVVEVATNPPPTDSNAEEPATAAAEEVPQSSTPAKDIEVLAEQVADIAEPSPTVHEPVAEGAHERSFSQGTVGEDDGAEENGHDDDDATSPTSPTEPATPVSPSTPSASKKNKKKKKGKK